MTKHIALRSGLNDGFLETWEGNISSQLKQQALLFDQIGVSHLRQTYQIIRKFNSAFQKYAKHKVSTVDLELEWLEENRVIFELPDYENLAKQAAEYFFNLNPNETKQDINKLSLKILEKEMSIVEYPSYAIDPKLVILYIERDALLLRLLSLTMETTNGVKAVTTLSQKDYTNEACNLTRNDVVQIVLNNLPLPDNSTPWEKIIDYRNDPKSQENLLALRRWTRKITTESLSTVEVEEEIEWLINEFQNHMNYHKIKSNIEKLEIITKAPFEVVENLAKLQFSKIPDPLFSLKKKQLILMEAELNAPGREMAYIIKTRDAFQSQE